MTMEEQIESLMAEQIAALQGRHSTLTFGEDLTPYLTGRDILFTADSDGFFQKRAGDALRGACFVNTHSGPTDRALSAVQLAWLASEFRHLLDDRQYETVTRRWRWAVGPQPIPSP